MHTNSEPSHMQGAGDRTVTVLPSNLHDDDPQTARIVAAQQLLFPATPQTVCEELGLNWWAALKLYEDGWLSYPPENSMQLDEAQEAELRFVGTLVMAGCDRKMLTYLLAGLPPPYAYDLRRLYFDWTSQCWRVLPDPRTHPEAVFTEWLELLVQKGDSGSLGGIRELAQDALTRLTPPSDPPSEFYQRELAGKVRALPVS